MSKQPKSHLKRLTTFDYINSAILLLVAVCCVYPFLYVFFVATTDGTYLARGEMTFLPMGFNLKAFGYCLCPENRRCGTLIYSRAKMTVRQWLAQARAATKKSTVQI